MESKVYRMAEGVGVGMRVAGRMGMVFRGCIFLGRTSKSTGAGLANGLFCLAGRLSKKAHIFSGTSR